MTDYGTVTLTLLIVDGYVDREKTYYKSTESNEITMPVLSRYDVQHPFITVKTSRSFRIDNLLHHSVVAGSSQVPCYNTVLVIRRKTDEEIERRRRGKTERSTNDVRLKGHTH